MKEKKTFVLSLAFTLYKNKFILGELFISNKYENEFY